MEVGSIFQFAGQIVKKDLIVLSFLTALNIIIFFITNSYSILANGVLALLYLVEVALLYKIIKDRPKLTSRREDLSNVLLISTLVILAVLVAVGYLAYIALPTYTMVREPWIAFFTPIVSLSVAGFMAYRFEEALREHLPYLGTRIADALRILLVAGSISFAGIFMNVLTIYWLDIAMTFIIILVGLRDGLYRIIRTYKGVKSEEERAGILKRLENEFLMTPVFRSIKNAWIGVLGYFVYGNFTLSITPLVSDDLLQELHNFIISRTIRLVPHMVSFGVTLERLDKDDIKVAIPIDSQDNVTSFDDTNRFKLLVVSYPGLEVKNNEDLTIEAPAYKIVPAQKARELALKKVDAVITKQISDLAENELKGWFIKIYITKTESIDEALKEALS